MNMCIQPDGLNDPGAAPKNSSMGNEITHNYFLRSKRMLHVSGMDPKWIVHGIQFVLGVSAMVISVFLANAHMGIVRSRTGALEKELRECRDFSPVTLSCQGHRKSDTAESGVTLHFSGLSWRVNHNTFGPHPASDRHAWVDKTGSLRIKMDRCIGAHLYTTDRFWFGFYKFAIAGGIDEAFHPNAATLYLSMADTENITIRFGPGRLRGKPIFNLQYAVNAEEIAEFAVDDLFLTEYHVLRTPTKVSFRSFQGHGKPSIFGDQEAKLFAPANGRDGVPQGEMPVHIHLVPDNVTSCDTDAGMVEVVVRSFRFESL